MLFNYSLKSCKETTSVICVSSLNFDYIEMCLGKSLNDYLKEISLVLNAHHHILTDLSWYEYVLEVVSVVKSIVSKKTNF